MKQFKASSANVEVNGETVFSIIDGMGAFKSRALKILSDNGIENPQPGKWYNQQAWLNAFKAISEQIGSSTLNAIGQKIPENAKFPPEINDIHKGLAAIDVAFHMNHRNGEIGNYKYVKIDDKNVKIVCSNPYPDEFDKGIIVAMTRKFKPANVANVKVNIDESQQTRAKGGDTTTYMISW